MGHVKIPQELWDDIVTGADRLRHGLEVDAKLWDDIMDEHIYRVLSQKAREIYAEMSQEQDGARREELYREYQSEKKILEQMRAGK